MRIGVVLAGGSNSVAIRGDSNTVSGSNSSNVNVWMNGSGNVVSLGTNTSLTDFGSGDTTTVVTGSYVQTYGQNLMSWSSTDNTTQIAAMASYAPGSTGGTLAQATQAAGEPMLLTSLHH